MSISEKIISFLDSRNNQIDRQTRCDKKLTDTVKKDEHLKSILEKKNAIRKISYIIIIAFFLITNIFVRYNNTIEHERFESEYIIYENYINALSIDPYEKLVMKEAYREDVKERVTANKLVLSLLVAGTSAVLLGAILLLEKKNYFIKSFDMSSLIEEIENCPECKL